VCLNREGGVWILLPNCQNIAFEHSVICDDEVATSAGQDLYAHPAL
jgi:hypothetical protein